MKDNDPKNIPEGIPEDYFILHRVLHDAFDQAAIGKGKERHATGEPYEDQICCYLLRHTGIGGAVFQVCKKAIEAMRLPYPQNINELHGAINYAAAAIIECERLREQKFQEAKEMAEGHRAVMSEGHD